MLSQGLIIDQLRFDLAEKVAICLGEVGAKTVIEDIYNFRKPGPFFFFTASSGFRNGV